MIPLFLSFVICQMGMIIAQDSIVGSKRDDVHKVFRVVVHTCKHSIFLLIYWNADITDYLGAISRDAIEAV